MPKSDRFAQQQKDAQRAKKKMVSEARKRTTEKEEEADEQQPDVAEEEDQEEYEEEVEVPARPEISEVKNKKETAADRKKQKAERQKDEMQLLAEEQRSAMWDRIKGRLLRLFIVGLVMEIMNGRSGSNTTPTPSTQKEGKGRKKGPNSGKASSNGDQGWGIRSISKSDLFGGPALMVAFVVMMLAVRLGEEGYHPDGRNEGEPNYYDVLSIPRDSDVLSVRKAYKTLALSWHPDKNPDCQACKEKFAVISKAYETLASPDRKKAYDQRRSPEGSIDSMASVELTAEDFESQVLRSNDIWIVQVYDPFQGGSKSFHAVWEEVALSHRHVARFGRIDVSRQKRALEFLPQRVVIMPAIFRFVRGMNYETFMWSGSEERGTSSFAHFVADSYPSLERMSTSKELSNWWAGERPRILIAGPGSAPRRGSRPSEFLQVQRLTHVWAEFFDFALADSRVVREALGSKYAIPETAAWTVSVRAAAGAGTRSDAQVPVREAKEISVAMQELIAKTVSGHAPALTVRNHQQLCGAGSLGQATRTFCVFLVNPSDPQAALNELNGSKATYAQEVSELADSGAEAEEPFHLQPVVVSTSGSRLPWQPTSVGPSFRAVWSEAKWADAFVLELETLRIAAVRPGGLKDLYQQIAYEDLKFNLLPESVSVVRALPDPEVTLRKGLLATATGFPGALIAFAILATAVAVLPELSLRASAISVAALLVLVLCCWPWAMRKSIGALWCTFSMSRFECQGNV